MARKMSDEEWHRFIDQGTRTGKLATTRKDGRPHVVPVWFIRNGEEIVFTTVAKSVKGHTLKRDGQACLCVDDESFPYAFVMIEGKVTLNTNQGELLKWATRIAERYVGKDNAERYGRRNAVEGELLVRLRPMKVLAVSGIAE